MSDFQVWRNRVTANVTNVTNEQIDAIANACLEQEKAGTSTGVWHETARYFNRLDTCPCYPCCQKRNHKTTTPI